MENVAQTTPIVVATRNRGKITEIQALLKPFPVDIKDLSQFGPIPPVVEDGATFEANAYKKASQVARVLGLPALADDSGLCVEALDGRPGVHSARYGGQGLSDRQRAKLLLDEMAGQTNRKAQFVCVLSLAVPTGPALTYEAHCDGQISEMPAGDNGFGYDPIFFYPALGKTYAQISRAEKARVSHRGKALAELMSEFDKVLMWIDMQMPALDGPH